MWSIALRYILKHTSNWVKKNCSVETTAANNGQKKKLALKITRKMQTDKTGVNGADPAENQTVWFGLILLKLNSKEMKWTPGHIFMLYYAVLAVFASGDRTSSV